MRELLAVGAHFGHQKRYMNPQMKNYIYGARNKIHIIDLQQTLPMLEEALNFIGQVVASGGNILFVGTKKATGQIIKEQAMRCDMPYVSHRWLGGMLTNFKTIKQSVKRLKDLETASQDGSFNLLTKKEALMRSRELEKLNLSLGGIKDMSGMPDAIFMIDVKHEKIALKEAKLLTQQIPVIAIVDTNCSPRGVDYVIPGNDDAFRAVRLYTSAVAETIIESRISAHDGLVEYVNEDGTALANNETAQVVAIETEQVAQVRSANVEESGEIDSDSTGTDLGSAVVTETVAGQTHSADDSPAVDINANTEEAGDVSVNATGDSDGQDRGQKS